MNHSDLLSVMLAGVIRTAISVCAYLEMAVISKKGMKKYKLSVLHILDAKFVSNHIKIIKMRLFLHFHNLHEDVK